ncbi:MAG: lytic transglycosylase domain-containing protein, partial [Oscillospiraceae bacterium]
IDKYSYENNLDKYLVYALIKKESKYDPLAVSKKGAMGLMQIMPDTFDWIANKLGEDNLTYDDMFKPEHNIKFGTYMYSYLMEENNSYEWSVAAYHAGRGAVNKWRQDNTLLDSLPPKTLNYVKKVMKSYKMYNSILNND